MSSDRLDELIRDRLSPDGQVLSLKAQFIREVGAKALSDRGIWREIGRAHV